MAGLTQGHIAITLKSLADDVLRYVEHDLRSFQTQLSGSDLEPIA